MLHCGRWHKGFDIWSGGYVAHRTGALDALPLSVSQGGNAPMAALELVGPNVPKGQACSGVGIDRPQCACGRRLLGRTF